MECGRSQGLFCDQDVGTVFEIGALLCEDRPHPPLGAVADNGITHFFTGRKAVFSNTLLREIEEDKCVRVHALASSIDELKFAVFFENQKTVYTASDFLPFARRRLITRRPFFVAIRVLKPCVRLRGVLCGWYVLFITISLNNF